MGEKGGREGEGERGENEGVGGWWGRNRENGVGAERVGGREVFDKGLAQTVPEASAQLKSHATSSS